MVFPERLTSVAIFSMWRLMLASETLSCSRRCATRNADVSTTPSGFRSSCPMPAANWPMVARRSAVRFLASRSSR